MYEIERERGLGWEESRAAFHRFISSVIGNTGPGATCLDDSRSLPASHWLPHGGRGAFEVEGRVVQHPLPAGVHLTGWHVAVERAAVWGKHYCAAEKVSGREMCFC